MYRGSWIVRKIIDTIPEDALKDFPSISSEVTPEEISAFDKLVQETQVLNKVIEAYKWGRLFGGAIAIIIIEGHKDLAQPLDIDDVQPDSFKGLIVVDRWSGCSPSSELVTDINDPAAYGLPKYYDVTTETSQTFRVHHSRCLRFTGRDLPLFEKQIQTYWGMSEVESVFQELQRRDYAASSIADLISRSCVIAMKEPMLAQMLSGVGLSQQQLNDYINRLQAVSQSIGTNGILAVGEQGEVYTLNHSFAGLDSVYHAFMLDVAAAAEQPLSRWYGKFPGLGDSGDGDLQIYEDHVDQKRKRELRPIFNKLIPIMCMSAWGYVPDDLDYTFPSIRTMTTEKLGQAIQQFTQPIFDAYNHGLIGRQTALRELKHKADELDTFNSITNEMIEASDDDVTPQGEFGVMPNENNHSGIHSGPANDAISDGNRLSDGGNLHAGRSWRKALARFVGIR
jgi:phage-related protein (TIGR01555 family)